MNEKSEHKVKIWNLIIRYSEPIIQILFIISKWTEYEYEYHYSVFYYSNNELFVATLRDGTGYGTGDGKWGMLMGMER